MSKRLPKPLESVTKKPKLDVTFNETSSRENKKININASTSSKNIGNNDLWEDIFLDDEQLEEIDFISSQACNDVIILFFVNLIFKCCSYPIIFRMYLETRFNYHKIIK